MTSTLTWLDFSEAERRRALEVLELFSQRETRDELDFSERHPDVVDDDDEPAPKVDELEILSRLERVIRPLVHGSSPCTLSRSRRRTLSHGARSPRLRSSASGEGSLHGNTPPPRTVGETRSTP
jgi:hypothetical protein